MRRTIEGIYLCPKQKKALNIYMLALDAQCPSFTRRQGSSFPRLSHTFVTPHLQFTPSSGWGPAGYPQLLTAAGLPREPK